MEKFGKRTIRVTKEHNEECKKLLRLLGAPLSPPEPPAARAAAPPPFSCCCSGPEACEHAASPTPAGPLGSALRLGELAARLLLRRAGVPVIDAPCEAEATCAELCKHGKARLPGHFPMPTPSRGVPCAALAGGAPPVL